MIEDEEALRAVLQDLGREFRDQMKKVADQVADVFKRATQQNVSDTAFLRRVAEEARAEWERHARWVQEAMSRPLVAPEFGEAIRKALDEAHLYYGPIVTTLGERGWYVDLERMGHPDVTEPLEMFEAGEPEKAHEALCVCFEEQMDDIVDGLRKAFPERARHVEQAVAAHRRREYALSIPVFLLEADGICQELVGAQAYQKEGGQRAIANAISSRARDDAFHLAMCAALITITPLVYGPKERAQHGMTDSVNRHTVLHGEDVNYDTRRNSCQALSFLAHVVSVLPDLKAPPTE